ncbi:MAG: hypothetical protein KJO55_10730, partial [Gammaproteobacteria bacterium]|nr:hypothetical protein [Gammaproteobacteria bacterium]
SWTLLLAVFAFSLSLLGTFLVRSGILVSVHAFATDPERGRFILIYMIVVILGSLLLYAIRAPRFVSRGGFGLWSREMFLLINNILLVIAAFIVLFGTLYPLFVDAIGGGKVSVGKPYFDLFFTIPMLPLAIAVGVGMHSRWKTGETGFLKKRLWIPAIVVPVLTIVVLLAYRGGSLMTTIGIATAVWVMASSLAEPLSRWRERGRLTKLPRNVTGMLLAHFGVGLFVLGVTVTSSYSVEQDLALRVGESAEFRGFTFELQSIGSVEGPNWRGEQAQFEVRRGERVITTLTPQKRVYRVQTSAMTEADIQPRLRRDLYVAMGEPLGEGAWSFRFQVKPLVRLIWLGCLFMLVGGALAASDRRYRRSRQPSVAREEVARA